MQRISITCLIPQITDGTSFYRGYGPLNDLKRTMWPKLELHMMESSMLWIDAKNSDIIFLQRPCTSSHLEAAIFASKSGIPLWVDYDDDLTKVPFENPNFKLYASESIKTNIIQIVNMATVVTVSTEHLKEQIFALTGCPRIRAVPNALDHNLLGRMKKTIAPDLDSRVCMWRGSGCHNKDLAVFNAAILTVARQNPDWNFTFFGQPFWMTIEHLWTVTKNVRCVEPLEIMPYFREMIAVAPEIAHFPLYDSEFNRSKSNIGWLEASYAGAACLVPDFPEWRKPGALTYANLQEYAALLNSMMKGDLDLDRLNIESMEFIMDNLRLEKVNKLREEIILEIMG